MSSSTALAAATNCSPETISDQSPAGLTDDNIDEASATPMRREEQTQEEAFPSEEFGDEQTRAPGDPSVVLTGHYSLADVVEDHNATVPVPALGRTNVEQLRDLIRHTQPGNPLALAETYLNLPQFENGKAREQDAKEFAIVVVEHFGKVLETKGWGAQVMQGSPHVFTGQIWTSIADADFQAGLGDFAEAMGIPPVVARNYQFRGRLLKQFYSRMRCVPPSREPYLVRVNLSNGTYEVRNGVEAIRKFRKEDLLTHQLPFAFDPTADCPRFQVYLDRVLPDRASQLVMAEFFGGCFVRDLKLEKMLLLFGGGSNGKSVTFDVINALFGEHNISNLSLKSLGKRESRFRLGNALLNFGSEISDECESDIFKKLVSGEPIEARRLYGDPFELRDYARLAFSTNVLLASLDRSEGFFRRLLIIPFDQFIPDSEKDITLAQKIIAEELPGVFNWVLKGMRRLLANGQFTACPASAKALEAYRRENDNVALFLEDSHYRASSDQRMAKDVVYKEYREYCKSAGYRALAKNTFGKTLKTTHRITETKSGSTRYWLLEAAED